MKSDFASALRSLPHGPEFRFIDRITDLVPGVEGAGEYTVRAETEFLAGHFPGEPMMPGVLMLEAGAQLAGVVIQSDPQRAPGPSLRLTGIRAAKIFGAAKPGETLRLRARITGQMGELVQAAVVVSVGERELLRGEVVLSGSNLPGHEAPAPLRA